MVDLGNYCKVIFLFGCVFMRRFYIEPLFNTYKPLADPKIREPILAMARANQIPLTQVLEVDASRQTTRVSAKSPGIPRHNAHRAER